MMAASRRSTLIFAVNINHVEALTNEFRASGFDARFVVSTMLMSDRLENSGSIQERGFSDSGELLSVVFLR